MSLPTPPSTAHREEKENWRPWARTARTVSWNDHHEIHNLTADAPRRASVSIVQAGRSILKKTNYETLPCVEESQREGTPEPTDPLTDLHYLDNPVAKIIAVNAVLRDLIEAYSVLAARIRACVTGNMDADASWPLFQPLRKHRDAIVQAMCRDLGRALEVPTDDEVIEEGARVLPSPEKSPKKRGMSAEAVKYARDLCTTCHAVLKLLSAVFTMPAIYGIFEESHLRDLLTHVLAIPLASELPTPNARKTYALAIWLLQYQRLPGEVLIPARDRIAYALRRGIEGELGKEGKKGSASDGLKAVHDLSICYPSIFIPAFTDLLPSIFAQLLAPTLVLRTQACHALGGFAYGLASLPSSAIHSRVAEYAASYLTKAPLGTPSKRPQSPTKDPLIIRTLRTTLGAAEPKHVAQGPVWALSVLAYFVVMLGPQVFLDDKLTKCFTALFALATRHTRSSVRTLNCLVWRAMTWAYFRPPPVKLPLASVEDDLEDSQEVVEDSEEESDLEYTDEEKRRYRSRLDATWKILASVTDMGAGVSTVGAVLATRPTASREAGELALRRALNILDTLCEKGGPACQEALDTVYQLVSQSLPTTPDAEPPNTELYEWSYAKLLPQALFSSNPGLLTIDYRQLAPAVKAIIPECPHLEELKPLSPEELTTDWIFDRFIKLWITALDSLKMQWGEQFPAEIVNIWGALINAKLMTAQDNENQVAEFAQEVSDILVLILKNNRLDFSPQQADDDRLLVLTSPVKPSHAHPSRTLPSYRWKAALKLLFVRQLWSIVSRLFPRASLCAPAERLLTVLLNSERNLVVDVDLADDVRAQWVTLCAEVLRLCDEKEMLEYWGLKPRRGDRLERCWNDSVRAFVWGHFVQDCRGRHTTHAMEWENEAILLSAPFLDCNTWDMANEDLEQWNAFLSFTMDRALDFGTDAIAVLDHIAALLRSNCPLSQVSATRVSDLLLSHLVMSEVRSLPADLLKLVNQTLVYTYPPTAGNEVASIWLLRTVTRIVDSCPLDIAEEVLEILQDGLCTWIMDKDTKLDDDGYDMDVLPMYQTALVVMMSLPRTTTTMENLDALAASAFTGRQDKVKTATPTFLDFWQSTYATVTEPDEGWSEKIQLCLRAVGLRDDITSIAVLDTDTIDDEEVESQLYVHSDDEISSPLYLSSLQSKAALPKTPTTPTMSASTVRRPYKPVSPVRPLAPLLLLDSPSRSPMRTPSTPKRRTPGSARARQEKENVSPLSKIASVTDRIAMRSPGAPVSVLGKRRFDSDDEDAVPAPSKRPHKDLAFIFGNTLENPSAHNVVQVNTVLVAPTTPPRPQKPSSARVTGRVSPKVADNAARPQLKKRKGEYLDAVEVPTLHAVLQLRRSVSLGNDRSSSSRMRAQLSATQSLPVLPSVTETVSAKATSSTLRRTRSTSKLAENARKTKVSGSSSAKKSSGPLSNVAIGKRKRLQEQEDADSDSLSSSFSSPLRRLREMEPFGSDDSIMLATPSLVTASSSSLSSDDDPHKYTGQVTPHRLVSPAIRRVLDDDDPFQEPGSDDSIMSASPTTDRVARMSQQKGKRFIKPTSLNTRLPSLSL